MLKSELTPAHIILHIPSALKRDCKFLALHQVQQPQNPAISVGAKPIFGFSTSASAKNLQSRCEPAAIEISPNRPGDSWYSNPR
jgi:hypothetical protein